MHRINLPKNIFKVIIAAILIFIITLLYYKYSFTKPNIIFIVVDALRADHLSCYGYERNTSLNIDKLAKEGAVFHNCFATSSSTVRASPAFLTGRYLEIISEFEDTIEKNNLLDKRFITLAKYLKNFGYFTASFLNNPTYKRGKGFEQGVDSYKVFTGDTEITDEAISFLKTYSGDKPFFIWMHYLGPHTPYTTSEEYFKAFENDKLYKENDKMLKLYSGDRHNPCLSEGYIPKIVFHKDKYNLNYYIARYDAAIRRTDFNLGELFKNIKDNTIIILTADHGEALGEHGYYFSHGESIYDELLHIPLIIKDGRYFKGGKQISTIASSVDIVPTILNRLNPSWYFFNKNRFDGRDLKRTVKSKELKERYLYSYFPMAWSIRDVKRNIKYILNKNGKKELYFLPDEDTNHINDQSPKAVFARENLGRNLKAWLKDYPIRVDINLQIAPLDEDTKQNLRTLGYLQ